MVVREVVMDTSRRIFAKTSEVMIVCLNQNKAVVLGSNSNLDAREQLYDQQYHEYGNPIPKFVVLPIKIRMTADL